MINDNRKITVIEEKAPPKKERKRSQFVRELEEFAKRLGEDGYPNAVVERAAERTDAMEQEIIRINKELDRVCKKCRCTCDE